MGKPLKVKHAPLFLRDKRLNNSSDRKWLAIVFLIVVILGAFIFLTAIRRDEDKYRKSLYYVNLNNHLYDV